MSVNDDFYKLMLEMGEQFKAMGLELEMPPNSIKTHNTEYTYFEPGTVLWAEFSFDERFTNPMKMYQGGFLCAALDDVFGPLTYMAAKKPAVTVQMNTTFIRPFTAKDKKIVIKAEVVSQTKSLLVLQAEVKTMDGKLIAISNNQSFILANA
ncbi:PaaI family thioesterase [Legionella maioricensis]|uniref:PaaI family thioesterase n=1 Tax=Legionella maioricensis TaxID=2896528 RepID=A0A9X2CZ80_9GAMM|nr:PaaI family thioesterase [Legionella maioricensis]MCL9683238.1 PaaI family thioesterase [Legionella maioricensis]MCL9686064.1 PaaI family thioesterase [Legionella maioricensis]